MVNIYTLKNALNNMGIYSLTQWKTKGVWYPLSKYNKPNTDIWVSIDSTDPSQYVLKLQANFKNPKHWASWVSLLWKNQYKLYPLLLQLFEFTLSREILELDHPTEFDYYYTFSEDCGTVSLIAKPRD